MNESVTTCCKQLIAVACCTAIVCAYYMYCNLLGEKLDIHNLETEKTMYKYYNDQCTKHHKTNTQAH